MKKGMPWASPSFDACTSWIFLGVTPGWHPQGLAFVHSSSYYIILSLHLKFFLHTKLHTIFISSISLFKKVLDLWKSFGTARIFIKNIRYCSNSFKKLYSPKDN